MIHWAKQFYHFNIGILAVDNINSTFDQQYNGEIGLRPRSSGSSELFIDALFNAGIILNRAFGLNLKSTSETSKATIGGYDESVVTDFNSFKFANLTSSTLWMTSCSKVAYNGVDQGLSASVAYVASGSSFISFETFNGDWNTIYSNISSGRDCGYSTSSGLRACTCTSIYNFKDMTFTVGDHDLTVSVDTWVKREASGICAFYIDSTNYSNTTSNVILGYTFMRSHYIYYDLENTRIGFYSGEAESESQSEGYLPTRMSLSLLILIFTFLWVF